jgi:hypothetical protein
MIYFWLPLDNSFPLSFPESSPLAGLISCPPPNYKYLRSGILSFQGHVFFLAVTHQIPRTMAGAM